MDYFAGLDVSVKDTSVCIVDDTGNFLIILRFRIDVWRKRVRSHALERGRELFSMIESKSPPGA